ncbi:hypothetical protein MMC19_002963 [Ptychographa xylographoides]|nr:hypothetical protein [Ptychographa xylographoides]
MSSGQPNGSRRRMMPSFTSNGVPPGTREINAAPMLEHAKPGIDPDGKLTVSRAIAMAGIMMHSAIPLLAASEADGSAQVFALEAIVK